MSVFLRDLLLLAVLPLSRSGFLNLNDFGRVMGVLYCGWRIIVDAISGARKVSMHYAKVVLYNSTH